MKRRFIILISVLFFGALMGLYSNGNSKILWETIEAFYNTKYSTFLYGNYDRPYQNTSKRCNNVFQNQHGKKGLCFRPISPNVSRWISELMRKQAVITQKNVGEYVVVTASSDNHFAESLGLIQSVQKFLPMKKVYYFDIGLGKDNILKLKSFCNVVYRRFDYDKYGQHTRKLINYAFKPLIIQEMLHESFGVYWLDSSGRVACNTSQQALQRRLMASGGLLLPHVSGHSVGVATHPRLFSYLVPDNSAAVWRTQMPSASVMFLYRTPRVTEHVIRWMTLCAADPSCTDIAGSTPFCSLTALHRWPQQFSGCHRYDQSAIAVLATNAGMWSSNVGTQYDVREAVCWTMRREANTRLADIAKCQPPH